MDEEVAFHLQMEATALQRTGLSESEARRRARLTFGGVERFREEAWDARGLHLVEHAARDIRHAWRSMLRFPSLSIVVVVSLGVGIGVNTAIFSWIQAVMLNPIPGVAESRGYYLLEPRVDDAASSNGQARSGQRGGTRLAVSWPEYQDLREWVQSFEELIAFRTVPFTEGESGQAVRVAGQLVSANYFSALGLQPALGRFPSADAGHAGEAVAVISHDYWQTRFAGRADVVGRTLRLNDRPVTVVAVAPRGFQGTVLGLDFNLWVPAELAQLLLAGSRELEERGTRAYSVIGTLHADATLEQAEGDVAAAMTRLAGMYPQTNRNVRVDVVPYWRSPGGPQEFLIPALAVLQGIMLVLLLAVCANTANLMLARATTRQHEIAVRRALGASRSRIVNLLLTESIVLALLGAALGIVIAYWGTNALRAGPMITAFPIRYQTGIDGLGLAAAVLLGVTCGLAFGIAPALQLLRSSQGGTLRIGSNWGSRRSARGALMGIEVGLALIVLVAAAIFLRSFDESRDTDPGFDRDGVLLAAYDLSGRGVDEAGLRAFTDELLLRVRGVPAVEAAAIARLVPLDIHGMPVRPFIAQGRVRPDAASDVSAINIVTPGYFATMNIPLLAGRDFVDLKDETAPPQVIVNEEFVHRYLERAEPLGRLIQAGDRTYTITAVASTTLYNSFSESPTPIIYFSYRDRPSVGGELHVRTRPGAELALAPEIRRIAYEIDPLLPIYDVRTLDQHVEKNLIFRRIPARMFAVLGPLLLILAAMGIYAVVAYAVSRRAAEIGLRLALGASARRVVGQVMSESMRVVTIGAASGWFIAFMIFIHVAPGEPLDPAVFAGVPALLLAVAALAAWVPARRASRVDPMRTLRLE
jgi:predicted permease